MECKTGYEFRISSGGPKDFYLSDFNGNIDSDEDLKESVRKLCNESYNGEILVERKQLYTAVVIPASEGYEQTVVYVRPRGK